MIKYKIIKKFVEDYWYAHKLFDEKYYRTMANVFDTNVDFKIKINLYNYNKEILNENSWAKTIKYYYICG